MRAALTCGAHVWIGSNSEVESHSRRVRSAPMNGHHQTGPTGPFRANFRSPLTHGYASFGFKLL
jgi:hypothetical protein